MSSQPFGTGDLLLSFQPTPMFAINHFLSNSSLSSKMPLPTPRLGKPLRPPPNPPSQNVRSITPAASSVFRKSLRCTTSGLNSPNPRVYKVYNHGPSSFSSLWLRCATPRAEGPSGLARPKHTRINLPHFPVPRFPPTDHPPSSLRSSLPDFERRGCRHVVFWATIVPSTTPPPSII